MKKSIWIRMIPSLVTLGNLFCGFLAIAYVEDKNLEWAAWLIFIAMIFDVLDGKVARLTNTSTNFGVELDSLADMISFGVAPAFLVKVLVLEEHTPFQPRVVWILSLLFVICAALRLARFNVETEQDEESHKYFRGLATPAAGGVLASLTLLYINFPWVRSTSFLASISLITFLLGALMVSRLKYVHAGIRFLKVRRPVKDLSVVVFLIAILAFEPRIFILILGAAFCGYAISGPVSEIWSLRHTSEENSPEVANSNITE